MTENQKVSEPHIVATGLSEDKVFEWMDEKVSAIRRLKLALADREVAQQALDRIDEEILRLTNLAAVDMTRE